MSRTEVDVFDVVWRGTGKEIKQAHVLRSSDALEKFLDLLELEFCSFVLEKSKCT